MTVVQDCALTANDPNRSPSPPPQYDSNGKRLNSREARLIKKLQDEKQAILEELVKLNPLFADGIVYIYHIIYICIFNIFPFRLKSNILENYTSHTKITLVLS